MVLEERLEDLPDGFCALGQADGTSPRCQIFWELGGAIEGRRQCYVDAVASKDSPDPLR